MLSCILCLTWDFWLKLNETSSILGWPAILQQRVKKSFDKFHFPLISLKWIVFNVLFSCKSLLKSSRHVLSNVSKSLIYKCSNGDDLRLNWFFSNVIRIDRSFVFHDWIFNNRLPTNIAAVFQGIVVISSAASPFMDLSDYWHSLDSFVLSLILVKWTGAEVIGNSILPW